MILYFGYLKMIYYDEAERTFPVSNLQFFSFNFITSLISNIQRRKFVTSKQKKMILAELQSVSKPLRPFHSLSHVYSNTFICMNVNKDLNLDWLSTCLTLAKPNYKASENNELNKTRWLHLNLVKFTFVVLFRFFNLPKATYTILCAS